MPTTYMFLGLAMIFIPGLVYARVFAWDALLNDYDDQIEDLECNMTLRRPLSADCIDEYIVLHRPELLLVTQYIRRKAVLKRM
jgi:hypothetical protein